MSNTFCVTITECKTNGDKATVGFVVANAALGSDKDTMVFLSTDGIWAAVRGEVDKVDEGEPFAPLKELVDKNSPHWHPPMCSMGVPWIAAPDSCC